MRAWPNDNLTGVLGASLVPGVCTLWDMLPAFKLLQCCSYLAPSTQQQIVNLQSCRSGLRNCRVTCYHLQDCSSCAAGLCAGVMGFHAAPLNPMGGIGNVTHGCPIRVSIQQVGVCDAAVFERVQIQIAAHFCGSIALSAHLGAVLLAA